MYLRSFSVLERRKANAEFQVMNNVPYASEHIYHGFGPGQHEKALKS